MAYSFLNEKQVQEARESLLQFCNAECLAHGTYILTIIIGFFAFTEIFLRVEFPSNELQRLCLGLSLDVFLILGLFTFARLVFWSKMASLAIYAKPTDPEKLPLQMLGLVKEKKASVTLLYQLENASIELVREYHPFWWFLSKYSLWWIFVFLALLVPSVYMVMMIPVI
jgi:hypothetical protein